MSDIGSAHNVMTRIKIRIAASGSPSAPNNWLTYAIGALSAAATLACAPAVARWVLSPATASAADWRCEVVGDVLPGDVGDGVGMCEQPSAEGD